MENNKKLKVTLAFQKITEETAIIGKLIGWWTKSDYCHVEIIIDDLWISSRSKDGVHVKKLKPLKDTYVYYTLDEIVLSHEDYNFLYEWLYKQDGKKYDYVGIIWSKIIPFRLESRNKWFCSELVTRILMIMGVTQWTTKYPQLIAPGDIAKAYGVE